MQLVSTLTGSDKNDPLLLLALGSVTKAFVGELVETGAQGGGQEGAARTRGAAQLGGRRGQSHPCCEIRRRLRGLMDPTHPARPPPPPPRAQHA